MADLYGYTLDYTLYRLTFAQTLALIDTHNAKEKQAADAAKQQTDTDAFDPTPYRVDENTPVDKLPSLSSLNSSFGAMFG